MSGPWSRWCRGSTRRYARSPEPLPGEVEVRGIGESAVSERFVVVTQRRLGELMRRDLSGLELVASMIVDVHFAEHVVLAAVGIERSGKKQILGLRARGHREYSGPQGAAVRSNRARLSTERTILVVIDGTKALRKAVTETLASAR